MEIVNEKYGIHYYTKIKNYDGNKQEIMKKISKEYGAPVRLVNDEIHVRGTFKVDGLKRFIEK